MKWVSDYIGEEYKDWEGGNKIFITSPTGSGNTQFILKTLLSCFSIENKKLYLVNRRILKKQMETEISRLPYEQKSNIVIEIVRK
ncbi:MAG: DEAD/DEAH box helicase family protein [Lachnospiraceae bacterium]|nr:DEAD/DEAH box helicase family protein [Lachnospiraceae bacterium]